MLLTVQLGEWAALAVQVDACKSCYKRTKSATGTEILITSSTITAISMATLLTGVS